MSYAGSQLIKADDSGASVNLSASMDFKDGSNAAQEYFYDANGNLTKDLNKGISGITYNLLNLPLKLTISNSSGSATNTYMYSADGQKLKTVQQWSSTNSKRTDYCGNMIYENGILKRILVDGGYIEGGVYYFYLADHEGNNRVVANASGTVVQTNHYYPFGMPFTEGNATSSQPYKYNGKELDTERGLNLYDYGARLYDPALARFTTVDPHAERYYSISPYAYCLNNPVNAVDPDGRLVIFINGMHGGSGGKSEYWKGLDTQVMNRIKDWNADYIDGSHGGTSSLPWNLSANERKDVGYESGKDYASYYLFAYKNDDGSFKETIKVITHSMGAAYAKGFIKGLIDAGVPINEIEFEADFAPFQPTKQKAVNGVRTYQFSHKNDDVANNKLLGSPSGKIEGVSNSDYSNADNENKVHAIETFINEVNKLPVGKYKVIDGKIVRN
jgi:RHS repeat-associated protein